MYVLGIDGGGTKTMGVIADEYGNVVAKEQVGSTNQNGVEIQVVEQEIKHLFRSLQAQSPLAFSTMSTVFAGMSGVDRPDANNVIHKLISKWVPPHVNVVIDNDGINALYSGTLGKPGIVQVAGTGSITFGINEKGERGRVGGWGYLIDDEGSGYYIGREALNKVFKAYDGRGTQTQLTNLFLEHFKIDEIPNLIQTIYQVGKAREIIAPLSKIVVTAAESNDEVAKEIIHQAGKKIGISISCLINQLFESAETTPVVLVGGMFNALHLLSPSIMEAVEEHNISVSLVKPEIQPVGGAVIKGLQNEGMLVDDSFKKLFESSFLKQKYRRTIF